MSTPTRDVLARFYAITVVDTGNNVRAGNWQAAVDAADQLLLVSTYSRDATGRSHLADTAVTVLSAATPTTDRRTRTELREHFTARTRAVIEIPYDPSSPTGNTSTSPPSASPPGTPGWKRPPHLPRDSADDLESRRRVVGAVPDFC